MGVLGCFVCTSLVFGSVLFLGAPLPGGGGLFTIPVTSWSLDDGVAPPPTIYISNCHSPALDQLFSNTGHL